MAEKLGCTPTARNSHLCTPSNQTPRAGHLGNQSSIVGDWLHEGLALISCSAKSRWAGRNQPVPPGPVIRPFFFPSHSWDLILDLYYRALGHAFSAEDTRRSIPLFAMTIQTVAIAVITVVYFIIRYFNRTDVPKIKGLPEIPGVPIFGNLLQLGVDVR